MAKQQKPVEGTEFIHSEDSNSPESKQNLRDLSNYLGQLLKTGDSSDFTLIVKGQKLFVHTIVLKREAYFKALVTGGCAESVKGEAELKNVEPDVVRIVLEFLYRGIVTMDKRFRDNVLGVLEAANMYGVGGLHTICEKHLMENVTIDNAIDLLNLAQRCNAEKLMQKAVDCILENQPALEKTEKWKTLKRDHPVAMAVIVSPSKRCKH